MPPQRSAFHGEPGASKKLKASAASAVSPLIQPFYPAIDGLRAVAFFMVFFVHYGTMASNAEFLQWGWTGVDLFFVISGFLITGILYDSLHRTDYFRGFYIRRALRIFPIFYAFWVLMLVLTPVLHIQWTRYNLAGAAYLGNFFMPGARLGLHPDGLGVAYLSFHVRGHLNFIDGQHLWSLCIEEQFYLVWPAILWLVRTRQKILRLCLIVIVVIPLLRVLYFHLHPAMLGAGYLYVSTWSRVDTLMVGAALALWLRGSAPSPRTLQRLAVITLFAAPLLLAVLYSYEGVHLAGTSYDPIVDTVGFTLIALASAGLLLLCLDLRSPLTRMLQTRWLVSLGRISYGLYFVQGILQPIFVANATRLKAHHLAWVILIVPFALTWIIASASFYFLESPFLRLKSRFAPRAGRVADPQPDPALR